MNHKHNIIDNIRQKIHQHEPKAAIIEGINTYHIATNALLLNDKIQETLINDLKNLEYIQDIAIIKGFLNIKLHYNILNIHQYNYNIGHNNKINIEYCSPNPTGPLHLGHLRATLFGAAFSELCKILNFQITTDIYINNAGNQYKLFNDSVRHYHNPAQYPNLEYKGEYIREYANLLPHNFNDQDLLKIVTTSTQKILLRMNIKHDRIIYETDQYNNAINAINILTSKNLIEIGYLQNQKKDGAMKIVKGDIIGGCKDFVVARSDNSLTYIGYDIGYSYSKFQDGFSHQICCVGEDHIGHIHKMHTIMKEVNSNINLSLIYTGIVKFEAGDKLLKMSKRQGNFITIEDVLNSDISINALSQCVFQYSEKKAIVINMNNINENRVYNIVYVLSQFSKDKQEYIDDILMRNILFWDSQIKAAFNNQSIHLIYKYCVDLSEYIVTNRLYLYTLPSQIYEIFHKGSQILLLNKL